MNQTSDKEWVIAITGASGATYGVELCKHLLQSGRSIHLLISDAGWRVINEELDWKTQSREQMLQTSFGTYAGSYTYHPIRDIGASIASGSFRTEGMVIIPCSMGTLGGIANGLADNLIRRAADVMLKEQRQLIIVPRETPLHAIHLENMLKLAKMGATILPAMPAFYTRPQTLEEVVSFLVGKVCDSMGIPHTLFPRWGETS